MSTQIKISVCFSVSILTMAVGLANDPCGMVPPIYLGQGSPITRIGLQQTYVFYKDGVETFVIKPGFSGKVDNFGMLIPFPSPPSLRKVPDNVFSQIANAVEPPEVVIDVRPIPAAPSGGGGGGGDSAGFIYEEEERRSVKVIKKEAVGMYEVVVLQAGSADALKKWMEENEFKYPSGMDKVCDEYIAEKWCFVAVKTKVGQQAGVNPKPGQRGVQTELPAGSVFDGHVQGMGFRFTTEELVVPMRLSAFNAGDMRNVVYILTDEPKKIRSIPEEYVVRQVSGKSLIANLTQPLPLRILGGELKDVSDSRRQQLAKRRNPTSKNGVAKDLFAADLLSVNSGELSLAHEEDEKELLSIGEHFGLRGPEIDRVNAKSLKSQADKVTEKAIADLEKMTMTVVDGDFPREILAKQNLTFAQYQMPAGRNTLRGYDPKINKPGTPRQGKLILGQLGDDIDSDVAANDSTVNTIFNFPQFAAIPMLSLLLVFLTTAIWPRRRQKRFD